MSENEKITMRYVILGANSNIFLTHDRIVPIATKKKTSYDLLKSAIDKAQNGINQQVCLAIRGQFKIVDKNGNETKFNEFLEIVADLYHGRIQVLTNQGYMTIIPLDFYCNYKLYI